MSRKFTFFIISLKLNALEQGVSLVWHHVMWQIFPGLQNWEMMPLLCSSDRLESYNDFQLNSGPINVYYKRVNSSSPEGLGWYIHTCWSQNLMSYECESTGTSWFPLLVVINIYIKNCIKWCKKITQHKNCNIYKCVNILKIFVIHLAGNFFYRFAPFYSICLLRMSRFLCCDIFSESLGTWLLFAVWLCGMLLRRKQSVDLQRRPQALVWLMQLPTPTPAMMFSSLVESQ